MLAIIKRIIAFFMSVLAFFGFGSKPSTEPAALPEIDLEELLDGRTAEFDGGYLKIADGKLIVALRGNPTTGFDWTSEQRGDSLELKGSEYIQDEAEPNLGGVGGTFIFTFEPARPGETSVRFEYARPWETGVEPAVTYCLQVVVSGDLTIGSLTFVSAD